MLTTDRGTDTQEILDGGDSQIEIRRGVQKVIDLCERALVLCVADYRQLPAVFLRCSVWAIEPEAVTYRAGLRFEELCLRSGRNWRAAPNFSMRRRRADA